MPVKALLETLNKELQSKQNEEIKQATKELVNHPVDTIKNDIMQLAQDHNLILAPLSWSNKNQEQSDNTIDIELIPDVTPQPQPAPELNNILPNPTQIPTLKLSFISKTKDVLTDEEVKLLETNNRSLENSFETFKNELDAQNMLKNNLTTNLRSGASTTNIPYALFNSAAIEQLFNKFLEFAPRLAPQAAKSHILKNEPTEQLTTSQVMAQSHEENNHQQKFSDLKEEKMDIEKSSFNPSPFSTRPKPRGTVGH